MTFAFSLIAVFLAGAVLGALTVFVVSIHRTRRVPLSETHDQRSGSISRHTFAGIRNDKTEAGQ